MTQKSAIKQTADLIRVSTQTAVLTGAGVSKESGVPTFRDAQTGLWAQYDPQQLATPQAFQRDPKLVWGWYEFRRELVRGAAPNPGHRALAQMEQRQPNFWVITQNVDDLHEQAGSEHVIHLHGNIARSKCFDDCEGEPTVIDISTLEWDADAGPPACPHCGAHVRPDVVWFGEMLPSHAINKAAEISQTCDLMLVVGTSGLVNPAASLPGIAKRTGATIIEVNPDDTPITTLADVKLRGPSGEMLPAVMELLDHA